MKKEAILVLLLTCLSDLLTAQVEKYASVIGGTETSGQFSIPSENSPIDFPRYWSLRFVPHIDYNVYKRLYLGVQFEYAFGEVENVKLKPQKGIGVGLKYYFKNNNSNRFLRDRIIPYTEISWNLLNYTIDHQKEQGFESFDKFSNHNIQLLTGINLRLFKYLYFDYALRGMYYSSNENLLLANRVGFQYHFGETRKFSSENKPSKEDENHDANRNKKLKLFDFRYFLKRTTFQGRYSYIFDSYDTGDYFYYKEKSLSIGLITSFSSDIYFGFQYQPIWINIRNQAKQQYYMVGPFIQYDFLRRPNEHRLFAEIGFYRGNLCTCGDDTPYKKENLAYIPIGFGYEKRLKTTNFYWGLSVHIYKILTESSLRPETYAHPTIGLAYRFSDEL